MVNYKVKLKLIKDFQMFDVILDPHHTRRHDKQNA